MEIPKGKILLIGSGETSTQGGRAIEAILDGLKQPVHFALLETPAGFELNSPKVIQRVGEYFLDRMMNYSPVVNYIRPEKISCTDRLAIRENLLPLLEADLIFLGPGSPTYTVKMLQNSLTWEVLSHAVINGAHLILASAAAAAFGKLVLPVYEIYKAGREPFWAPGLNFFGIMGLNLILVPHWNNQDGGKDLDTSRCFVGQARFNPMVQALSGACTVVGIDELTGCILDFQKEKGSVTGKGQVHVVSCESENHFSEGQEFPLGMLGKFQVGKLKSPSRDLEWMLLEKQRRLEAKQRNLPDAEIQNLIAAREKARKQQQWNLADHLRKQVQDLGWEITDTPEGPRVDPL